MQVPATSEFDPDFDHPAWTAGLATVVSYGLVLVGLFVLLFAIPFVFFLVV
ncbi:MAG: hypothetical protein ABEK02_06880 [Haloquadratum sp.]